MRNKRPIGIRGNENETVALFSTQMKSKGWKPLWSIFNPYPEWRHAETGKIVDHNEAFFYYWMSGNTPTSQV